MFRSCSQRLRGGAGPACPSLRGAGRQQTGHAWKELIKDVAYWGGSAREEPRVGFRHAARRLRTSAGPPPAPRLHAVQADRRAGAGAALGGALLNKGRPGTAPEARQGVLGGLRGSAVPFLGTPTHGRETVQPAGGENLPLRTGVRPKPRTRAPLTSSSF